MSGRSMTVRLVFAAVALVVAGVPLSTSASLAAEASPTSQRPNKAIPLDLKVIAEKVARYPSEPFLLNEYGNQLIKRGRLQEARAIYERALEIDPGLAVTWNNLGVAHAALGSHRRAVKAYRQALRTSPNYAMAHYNLGSAYDAMGRYNKAIRSYQRAIELDPGLLSVKNNPHAATNRHLVTVLIQSYVDRGGSVLLPVQSTLQDR